jgi:hypothetical protein
METLNRLTTEINKVKKLLEPLEAKKLKTHNEIIQMDIYQRKLQGYYQALHNMGTGLVLVVEGLTDEEPPRQFGIVYTGITREEAIYISINKLKTGFKSIDCRILATGKVFFTDISKLLD